VPGVGEAAGVAARAGGGGGGVVAGKGWRGPERICPGRGAGAGGGAGLAGIGVVRNGGCRGALPPTASGGRKGAGFARKGSSATAWVVPSVCSGTAVSATGAGALLTAGCSTTEGVGATCSSSGGASSTATAVAV